MPFLTNFLLIISFCTTWVFSKVLSTMVLCSNCNISLDADERVLHVKSEWHVYNLKRAVANLPPISEELFNQKKQFFSEPVTKIEKKSYCEACKSSFVNSRSYEAHLKSKKHILNAHSGKK
ncbi:hypothetical protein PHET_12337 [Paragonimus heterotremus]|uniref:C2H2-type domain-containing protein n=1 Tax=Paragonimus heterotremus TaxID=100268 RepID=A0A8J4T5L0_9TREM|nr:hypothetical protein PHET_12337 [Paragonimus heterotremus]